VTCSCIFFDLFDTLCLVDETRYYKEKRAAAELAGIDYDFFMACWRATAREAILGKLDSPYARAREAMAKAGCFDHRVISEIARLDVETILGATSLYDGVESTLATLRESGFRLGLLSNATPTTAFLISKFNLRSLLDPLILSYERGVKKPDKEIYRIALEKAEAHAAETAFVGDGANGELDGARRAGMETVRITHPARALSFLNPLKMSSDDHREVLSFEELLALPLLQA